MLAYPSGLDLSSSALWFLTEQLAARRRERGPRWRQLGPEQQALMVLAHLRSGHSYSQLAAGFGVGIATVYRYGPRPSTCSPPSPSDSPRPHGPRPAKPS
ncbi:hypothetical protein GCM10010368_48740 [Streptomyces roseiscleroticus]|uniref:Transposase Helix-turn-helix domain-containing protein n=1 Tax=Streptomyces roseiscleroticus TaxID=1972 RepID=A0ABP5RSD0_9ACTN